ncbi:hypothetical protein DFJ74DRAFT_702617 [Hyaloraphidium curvatum]|nr:hypothetical protein DFJ74DRAFT_702617 [Hyaloraphidium curvatum]
MNGAGPARELREKMNSTSSPRRGLIPRHLRPSAIFASVVSFILHPFLTAAPTRAENGPRPAAHSISAFIEKVVTFVVPKTLRDLMSFKTADRIAHQLAHDVLEDVSGDEPKGPPHAHVPGEQESPTDPRVVRPPPVTMRDDVPVLTVGGAAGMPDPTMRIVRLPLQAGTVESDIMVWEGRPGIGDVKQVLVMVSGNPGIVDFYNDFLSDVHTFLGKRIAIVATGHIGHSTTLPAPDSDVFSHTLAEQVEAKIALVRQAMEWYPSASIYIAGHSIGAWISSQVLKALEDEPRIKGLYCLFPTLEDIVNTPNGVRQHRMFKPPWRNLLAGLISSLRLALPTDALVDLVARLSSQPPEYARITALRLAGYSTVLSALIMSDDEMSAVAALDRDFFARNAHRVRGYYSTRDAWAPLAHYRNLRSVFPPEHLERLQLDPYQLPHAFVLDRGDAEHVAGVVAGWLKEDLGEDEEVRSLRSVRSGWSREDDEE